MFLSLSPSLTLVAAWVNIYLSETLISFHFSPYFRTMLHSAHISEKSVYIWGKFMYLLLFAIDCVLQRFVCVWYTVFRCNIIIGFGINNIQNNNKMCLSYCNVCIQGDSHIPLHTLSPQKNVITKTVQRSYCLLFLKEFLWIDESLFAKFVEKVQNILFLKQEIPLFIIQSKLLSKLLKARKYFWKMNIEERESERERKHIGKNCDSSLHWSYYFFLFRSMCVLVLSIAYASVYTNMINIIRGTFRPPHDGKIYINSTRVLCMFVYIKLKW